MPDIARALAHLEDAEAAIMSWWDRMDSEADDDGSSELPFATMLAAVLRSVSRAAGAIESDGAISDLALARDGAGRICSITYEGRTYVPQSIQTWGEDDATA